MIRGKVYSLEQQHQQMKSKYVPFRPIHPRRVHNLQRYLSRRAI
jgi:hypothetical protein